MASTRKQVSRKASDRETPHAMASSVAKLRQLAASGEGQSSILFAAGVLIALLIWTYFQPISGLVERWWTEPDYVYGFLVPVFAAYLLWVRRGMLEGVVWQGSWWGLALLAFSALIRWSSAHFFFALIDPLSLVPCLAGLVLFVGGWKVLRWAWPGIVFLVFMVPLPGFLADQLSHPLQRIGTILGTYLIQTIGVPAAARGNVIHLPSAELGVVEACTGLRMMMLFFAVCIGMALYIQRSALEKVIIVASAVPIALIANIARIVTTAVLFEIVGPEWGHKLFHDLAGWFMMPLAVLLLWLELEFMNRIFMNHPDGPLVPDIGRPGLDSG